MACPFSNSACFSLCSRTTAYRHHTLPSLMPGLSLRYRSWDGIHHSLSSSSGLSSMCQVGCRKIACRMMLTSQFPDRVASPNRPNRWSARAIKAFSMAELEARKMKYPATGTEALLMGLLTEGTSQAARYLRANEITLFAVRDETVKLLGKADMYFFSPEHPPLTEPAQKALDWAVEEKRKSGDDGVEVTATHLLLGIWAQKGSAGQQVLAALGFDDKKAEELEATLRQSTAVR